MIAVGLPVMILAGIATYFNSRASVARQSPEAAANPQTAMMNKLALYVFPFGVVVGGPFLPLAIIMYWLSNNIWTFGQQHYVFGKIEKEEEPKKQAGAGAAVRQCAGARGQAGEGPQGRGSSAATAADTAEIAADSESAATPATNGAEAQSSRAPRWTENPSPTPARSEE